ncbi:unnamed protein product [Linum tenue]|uniref:OTU domain-containing protein n=1 Tax=Linum tenue TaxID=586396 RepID=A0AAV0KRN5_9ROSI|nr:unnamed protein product [Linum tenue]
MAEKPTNETILQLLKHGAAHFELVPSPVPSISATPPQMRSVPFFANNSHRFFARIGPALDRAPPETKKKLEQYSVQKVTGDGRCLFRALVSYFLFSSSFLDLISKSIVFETKA